MVPDQGLVLVGVRTKDPDRPLDEHGRRLSVLSVAVFRETPSDAECEEVRTALLAMPLPMKRSEDAGLQLEFAWENKTPARASVPAIAERATPSKPPPTPGPAKPSRRWFGVGIAAVATLTVALVCIFAFQTPNETTPPPSDTNPKPNIGNPAHNDPPNKEPVFDSVEAKMKIVFKIGDPAATPDSLLSLINDPKSRIEMLKLLDRDEVNKDILLKCNTFLLSGVMVNEDETGIKGGYPFPLEAKELSPNLDRLETIAKIASITTASPNEKIAPSPDRVIKDAEEIATQICYCDLRITSRKLIDLCAADVRLQEGVTSGPGEDNYGY